jgi:hypothetical protein
MTRRDPATTLSPEMRKSYIRVVIVWVIVLVSLYLFQEAF